MSVTFARDVTSLFYSEVPKDRLLCGYDTGSSTVRWTHAMWLANPDAVHIDQDSGGTSYTSDVLDVESGAVPVGSPLIAKWAVRAAGNFDAATRPGQRKPLIYCSLSNVTANVNALLRAGVKSGVGLWIAEWNNNTSADIAALEAASGPFPVAGFQYTDNGDWDSDLFSSAWLADRSGQPKPPSPVPGDWTFGPCRSVVIKAGATTTFSVTGESPGIPAPLGVGSYDVVVCADPGLTRVLQRHTVPKSPKTSAFSYAGHGLRKGQQVTVAVRPIATDGGHAGPWVQATITTGS